MRFQDRRDGGRRLADLLRAYRDERPVVLALPRGGVPVAYEVALALDAPLDVIAARKIGAPDYPEYAIGAIAEGGAAFVEPRAMAETGTEEAEVAATIEGESIELRRRVGLYRGDRPAPEVRGRTVILVDDGIATGRTARAAIRALRLLEPRRLVLAAPVVASETAPVLRAEVDDLVYVHAPEAFMAVGLWYERFGQTGDGEVLSLLAQARDRGAAPMAPDRAASAADAPNPGREVAIPAGGLEIRANLAVPEGARAMVLFVHGSGSSRFSPRNLHVARVLQDAGLGTLLLDLVTGDEEAEDPIARRIQCDMGLLAGRLVAATRFVQEAGATAGMRLGYLGASSGAAVALVAATELPGAVGAVVSRGGRPDLAGPSVLRSVLAPTLLVVGAEDGAALELNRAAYQYLGGEKRLSVVPRAGHLFEEPGALDVVADLAAGWFARRLAEPPGAP